MIYDWFQNLVWFEDITMDTPLRQIGWVYVLLIVLIYKLITLVKKL